MTTQTHRPATPEVLYGKGAHQFNVAEFAGATPRLAPCWHSALPAVYVAPSAYPVGSPGSLPHVSALTVPRQCGPRWVRISVALLSFLLPLATFAQEPCKVNVNTAPPAQLALLIQTGPALAAKIEAARKDPKTGAAVVLDAAKLDAVSGIGIKWLEYNSPHVAYVGPTTCTDKLKKPAAAQPEASGGER